MLFVAENTDLSMGSFVALEIKRRKISFILRFSYLFILINIAILSSQMIQNYSEKDTCV